MKRFVALFTLLTLFTPSWTLAQTSLLPTLQQVRTEFPQDWTHEDRGTFLNKVAWTHRADGWGLLRKPGGNRCPTPQGIDISCDYLVFGPTMQGFDVLGDETTPTWRVGDNFSTTPGRFLLPIAPNSGTTEPNPGTPALGLLQQTLNEFRQEFHEETIKETAERLAAEEERKKQEEFRQKVGVEYGKFLKAVGKYGSLVAAGLLGGKFLFGGGTE